MFQGFKIAFLRGSETAFFCSAFVLIKKMQMEKTVPIMSVSGTPIGEVLGDDQICSICVYMCVLPLFPFCFQGAKIMLNVRVSLPWLAQRKFFDTRSLFIKEKCNRWMYRPVTKIWKPGRPPGFLNGRKTPEMALKSTFRT